MQSAPTCIGFCRGGECASCGSSGLPWPWWLCLWPHAARCSRRGPGERRGTCLNPLRSCRTDWTRFVSYLKAIHACKPPSPNITLQSAPTIIFTLLELLQTIKCLLCNFFRGCGYGNRRGGYIEKCKSTLGPSPLSGTSSNLLHSLSAWHVYCSPIVALNACGAAAYFCDRPTSATPPCLITLVPVCAPVLSQFTGMPQLCGM